MDDHRHHDLEERVARLDALEERITRLEAALDSAGQGEKYYQSGEVHPELDDQTIAP